MQLFPTILLMALALEALAGYPHWVYGRVGHPVTWIGALISTLEQRANSPAAPQKQRRIVGTLALATVLFLAGTSAWFIQSWLLLLGWAGLLVTAVLASTLLAQRSLHDHVADVAEGLERSDLAAARQAVGRIVGRNPNVLDEAGVARAAIESLAENFADGVVAPAFWMAVAGLPGGVLYKTINTADSMIGHKTNRYLHYGWAAARLDDLLNLPASRLAALWLILAATSTPTAGAPAAIRCVRRDAHRHRSPNAGWPEAAMAGALGLKLNGPRVYGDVQVDDAYMGDGRVTAKASDIRRALALYRRACWIQAAAVGLVCVALLAA